MSVVYTVFYYTDSTKTHLIEEDKVWDDTSGPKSSDTFLVKNIPINYEREATGDVVTITYKPGPDSLGLSWTEQAAVYLPANMSSWSNAKLACGKSVAFSSLLWNQRFDDGANSSYSIDCFRTFLPTKSIQLVCPTSHSWYGYYGSTKYLTINDGFGGEQSISLNSQVNHVVQMSTWDSINDVAKSMSPGSTYYIGYVDGSITVRGTRSSLYHTKQSSAKTYKQLIDANLGEMTTREIASTCSVQLNSEHESFHESQSLDIDCTTEYEFNCWKTSNTSVTSSNTLNLSGIPYEDDVTIYADWKVSRSYTDGVFPEWSTTELLPCGSDPVENITVNCYSKDLNVPYHTVTLGKYVSKQAMHSHWTDGTTVYDIEEAIPFQEGATTYTAVWVVNDAADAVYSIPNNRITIPAPQHRPGFTYLGLANSSEDRTPEYLPEEEILVESNMTLYAVWKADGAARLWNGSEYKVYQIYIYDGSNWKMYMPKIYDGSSWDKNYV